MLGETGYLANSPYNSTPAVGYTVAESGNYLSGAISLSETGADRNGLMLHFDNTSNAVAGNGPGDVEYSPVGPPILIGGSLVAGSGPAGDEAAAAADAAYHQLGLDLLHQYCWAFDDPVTLATGDDRPIESLREGEFVLSASGRDPEGTRHENQIAKFFDNGRKHVIRLEVEARLCRPTPNHPIYAHGRGFVPAGELRVGDELLTDDSRWVKITAVEDKGEIVPVFNLAVANDRTYFVGSRRRWGFCFLVHNQSPGEGVGLIAGVRKVRAAQAELFLEASGIDPSKDSETAINVTSPVMRGPGMASEMVAPIANAVAGTKAGVVEFASGAVNVTKAAAKAVAEVPLAAVDAVGIGAEAASRAVFDTDWQYTPLSSSGQDEGGTFGGKVANRSKEFAKQVGTLGTAEFVEGYMEYQQTGDPRRMQNAAGGLVGQAAGGKYGGKILSKARGMLRGGRGGGVPVPEAPAPEAPAGKFPNCFPAGVPVSAEHGQKPIEDIRGGERVWAFDLTAGKWELRRVVEVYQHDYVGDLVAISAGGENVESTERHPFWVIEGDRLAERPRAEHVPEAPKNAIIPGR